MSIEKISLELQEYFNLNENEVIPPTPDDYQDEFQLCINNSHYHLVEVVTLREAILNAREFLPDGTVDIDKDRVDMYKRLNSSRYYWRWL